MKNKTAMGTFGRMEFIDDFLPPPDKLIFKEPKTKITITLNKQSVDFFKAEARRLNTSYQRMIRNLLQKYMQQVKSGAQS